MSNNSQIDETAIEEFRAWIKDNQQELALHGISGIEASYWGGEDSGAFVYIGWIYSEQAPQDAVGHKVPAELEELVEALLPSNCFEIGDGGCGTICAELTGEVRHTSYYITQAIAEEEAL